MTIKYVNQLTETELKDLLLKDYKYRKRRTDISFMNQKNFKWEGWQVEELIKLLGV